MDVGTVVALIIGAIVTISVSVVVPLRMLHRSNLAALESKRLDSELRREEKREDYARQDAVAAKAEEAARLLIASNQQIATVTAETAKATDAKLKVLEDGQHEIHSMVDGRFTAVLNAQLMTLRTAFVLATRVVAMAGDEPSQDDLDTLAEIKAEMEQVRALVETRASQEKASGVASAAASGTAAAAGGGGDFDVTVTPKT